MKNKQEILGQYFTNTETVDVLLSLLLKHKEYKKNIKVLEPSFGTGNLINKLKARDFFNIDGYEIDRDLTDNPTDFFDVSLDKKYDLIVGNPPFSKFNLRDSYYIVDKYSENKIPNSLYLTKNELSKEKERIENIFILKSLKHLKNEDSSIAFVLPISFFIKNKNKSIKDEILKYFSTIIIYQNDKVWFDKNIPCCFAIFTNIDKLKNKIILNYENGKREEYVFDLNLFNEELIPQVIFNKNNGYVKNDKGIALSEFLEIKNFKVKKSFTVNNISAKNILTKDNIPKGKNTEDYKIAVVGVGNSSVGKCGLINQKEDILNDMFYIFDVKDVYKNNKKVKQSICNQINSNIDYFKNITCRVGSKSIKREDILNFKVTI